MNFEKDDCLFKKWKKELPKEVAAFFVPDGIVDIEKWNKSKLKVLFFLKEANIDIKNVKEINFDERDYLKNYNIKEDFKNTHSPTINSLIQWIYGIKNMSEEKEWLVVESETEKENVQNDLLAEIALVNAKKIPGGGTVNWFNFDEYFKNENNKKFLFEQLDSYQPDIFICGKTAWILEKYKPEIFSVKKWLKTTKGIRYLINEKTIYIDFVHPDIRAPKNIIYYALVDAIKEILNLLQKDN